jgi:hypothetical protein
MGERKLVRRSYAIILGILCIFLLGSTVGAIVYYDNANVNNVPTRIYSDADYLSLKAQLDAANEPFQASIANSQPCKKNLRATIHN